VFTQVIAVQRDVQRADRDVVAFEGLDPGGQPVCQRHAPGGDAEQHDVVRALGLLQDLVGDSIHDAGQFNVGQDNFVCFNRFVRIYQCGLHGRMLIKRWACQGRPPSPPHWTGR
jgi:hypothetical protein